MTDQEGREMETMPRHTFALLQEQARDMRDRYPELYDYLRQRDAELTRMLRRIPSPADVELSASFDLRSRIGAVREALGGGLETLGDRESPDGGRSPLFTNARITNRPVGAARLTSRDERGQDRDPMLC